MLILPCISPSLWQKLICLCGKPARGLLFKVQNECNIDLNKSVIFYDKASGIQAGKGKDFKLFLGSTRYGKAKYDLLTSHKNIINNSKEALNNPRKSES